MLQGEHSAILLTIKLPFVIKIFILSIFEWPFYTVAVLHRFYCTVRVCVKSLRTVSSEYSFIIRHHIKVFEFLSKHVKNSSKVTLHNTVATSNKVSYDVGKT